jgi:eukaryotic-like serine/threonine-protein kinase
MPELDEEQVNITTPQPTDDLDASSPTEPPHRPWYRRKWFLVPIIILVGGAAAIFILDQVIMPFYVKSDDVAVVPKVVGMKKAQAIQTLTDADYEPVEYEVRFDDKVAEGIVIRQTPEPGEETKSGRKVFLVISGGKEMVVVPDLTGKSVRDAKMQLLKSNLTIGEVEFAYSEAAPNGTIFKQAPSAGTKISSATTVNIVVSQGPLYGRVPVPDLKGLLLSEAISALNNAKLTLGNVNWESRPEGRPNTVIEQYPTPGELLIEGSAVDLFVIREVVSGSGEN